MICMRQVCFAYLEGAPVLRGFDLEIGAGLTLLVGPNGCGKSTLMKIAAGVERPDEGTAEIDGLDLWRDEVRARSRIAYVPEQPDLTPYATIDDVMRLVCRLRGADPEAGRDALARLGLAGVADRSVRELSMGQRRRAVLATAWIGSARVLLLDEPLEALDRAVREELLAWIERKVAEGRSVVVATHELEPFLPTASRAITVRDGAVEVLDPLPADPESRLALLEAWARGEENPSPEASRAE